MANLGRIRAGQAEIEIVLRDKQFQAALRHIEMRMRQLRLGMPKFNFSTGLPGLRAMNQVLASAGTHLKVMGDRLKVISGSLNAIGFSMVTGGVSALFAGALPTRDYVRFSDQIQILQAVTAASADEIARLEAQARELGKSTSFSPKEAAEGQVLLARGGFSPQEIEDTAASLLALARAANTDLVTAGDTIVRVLRGFNLEATESAHVADVVTATVNGSAQVIEDYAEAIKTVGAVARQTNTDFETVSAAIAGLADSGIRGTLAGTGLRRMLLNLANPDLRKQFEEMLASFGGVAPTFVDAAGNMRPFLDIIDDLDAATAQLGTADRLAVFEQLFGRGTTAAINAAGAKDFLRNFSQYMRDAEGVAENAANVIDGAIGGTFRRLQSAAEDALLTLGESLAPAVDGLADVGQRVINWMNEWVAANRTLVPALGVLAVTVTTVGGAILSLGFAIRIIGFSLAGIGSAVSIVSSLFAALLSPVGLVTAGIVAAGAALLHFTGVAERLLGSLGGLGRGLREDLVKSFKGLESAVAAGDLGLAWRIVRLTAQQEFARLRQAAEESFGGLMDWIATALSPSGLAAIWGQFGVFAVDSFESVRAGFQAMVDGILAAGQFLGVTLPNIVWEGIRAMFPIFETLGQRAADSVLTLLGVGQGVLGLLTSFVTDTAKMVNTVLTDFEDNVLTKYTSIFGGFNSAVKSALANLAQLWLDTFLFVSESAGISFRNIADLVVWMVTTTIDKWGGMVQAMAAVFGDFGYFLDTFWQEATGGIFSALSEWGQRFSQATMGMFDDWRSFVTSLQRLWAITGTFILSTLVSIGQKLGEFIDLVAEFFSIQIDLSGWFEGMNEVIDQGLQDRLAEIEREAERKRAEAQARSAAGRADNDSDLTSITEDLNRALEEARAAQEAKLKEAMDVAKNIQRFDREQVDADLNLDEDPLASPLEKTLKTMGAFQASAAQRLGGGSDPLLGEMRKFVWIGQEIARNTAKKPKVI